MNSSTLQDLLRSLYQEVSAAPDTGVVAQYIPELARVSPDQFGVHLHMLEGPSFGVGDHQEQFSIQSIVKVLSLSLAYRETGETIWKRVGVEPSGNPFNSLWQLEYEGGRPRNALINSGAIVICDMLCSLFEDPWEKFIEYVRHISGNPDIRYNPDVANSEKLHGHRNMALIHMMKASGNIHNDIDRVMDLYFKQCAIEMSCEILARTFLLFANHGILPASGEKLMTSSMTKRINAIMQTCGFYDEAGEYTFRVGLPGKSGVGGGIVAIHPGHYAIAVWSPRLNTKGNSVKGMDFLERWTTGTGVSIF